MRSLQDQCGGSGARLWPLSRAGFPKQFLVLSGTNSLFQQAIERANGLAARDIGVNETLVVTNEVHRFLALDQLRELKTVSATLILEPVGRNTAPALTLAALHATANGEDPILVVTPADQTVTDSAAFTSALQKSVRVAASGSIAILGIPPTAQKQVTVISNVRAKQANTVNTRQHSSLKSPSPKRLKPILRAVNTLGTAACLCSRPAHG